MIQNFTTYVLTGFIVAILIPWACLETASFLSNLKSKPIRTRHTHWLWAALLVGSLALSGALSGCAGGSKDNAGDIVSPKGDSGAGVTKTESEGLEELGGTTAGTPEGGGDTGGSTGPSLGEPPLDPGTDPALIMQVVNTILN